MKPVAQLFRHLIQWIALAYRDLSYTRSRRPRSRIWHYLYSLLGRVEFCPLFGHPLWKDELGYDSAECNCKASNNHTLNPPLGFQLKLYRGTNHLILAMALFAGSANADTISYLISANDQVSQPGQYASFVNSLAVPQFDHALGTLDAVRFQLGVQSWHTWNFEWLRAGMLDLGTRGTLSFLGRDYAFNVWALGGMYADCGNGLPDCLPRTTGLGNNGIQMSGRLVDVALAPFIGEASLALPLALNYEAFHWEEGVGSVRADKMARFGLSVNYDFTSGPPLIVAHAPEPGTLMILIGFVSVGLYWKRR